MKTHSEEWFNRWEQRIHEPFKNTKIYNYLPAIVFIVVFLVSKDYYHGWQSLLLSIIDISIFFRFKEFTVLFLLDALVWLIKLIIQIIALYFFVKSFVNIARCKYYETVFYDQSTDYLGSARAVTFTGPPGCGKTFSGGANFAPIIAEQRWQKLKSDYFLQKAMLERWINEGDVDKLKAFEALKESYQFYAERENELIPCLVSSIPLQDGYGRFSYELTDEVQLQLLRVPEYSVLFNDESGLTQGSNTSRTASDDIIDFYRFNRHMGDFILINTEQGTDGNGKYIRKVTDYNIMLQRQKWVMPPKFLLNLLEKAKNRYFKQIAEGKLTEEKAKYKGESLYYFEKYLKTIGFRQIPYTFGMSEGNVLAFEQGEYVFPAHGNAIYDDRSYRELYKAKNEPLELQGWTSLVIEADSLRTHDAEIKSADKIKTA